MLGVLGLRGLGGGGGGAGGGGEGELYGGSEDSAATVLLSTGYPPR